MFTKELPAGQYVITGNLAFQHTGNLKELPEEMNCVTELNGKQLAQSNSISPQEEHTPSTSAAVIVASTGETTGGMLEVKCTNRTSAGPQDTHAIEGTLAATGVQFR